MKVNKYPLPAYFYATSTGKEPVREWLQDLSKDDKKIIGEDIKTVQYGWPIGMPLVRSLGDGVWEVRSSLASNRIARVLFFMHDGAMILLHGIIKKTQTTPVAAIALAKRRKDEVQQ